MKVRAKWSVKDAGGWHDAGEVFETQNDLGDAVEVLEGAEQVRMEDVIGAGRKEGGDALSAEQREQSLSSDPYTEQKGQSPCSGESQKAEAGADVAEKTEPVKTEAPKSRSSRRKK